MFCLIAWWFPSSFLVHSLQMDVKNSNITCVSISWSLKHFDQIILLPTCVRMYYLNEFSMTTLKHSKFRRELLNEINLEGQEWFNQNIYIRNSNEQYWNNRDKFGWQSWWPKVWSTGLRWRLKRAWVIKLKLISDWFGLICYQIIARMLELDPSV